MVPKRLFREVGTRKDWLLFRCEEDGHGPAAPSCGRRDNVHIDAIDVGAFLTVDLDVDEVVVHEGCGFVVLEGLMRHHVAPVAGGVPD